jgi:aminomethyltransferase
MNKTKLNNAHKKLKGRMIEFAGFEMPIWYSSMIKEHKAVRTAAGLFDVSHMGEIFIEGPEAEKMLNYLTANNVSKLKIGRIHYNALLTSKGTFVDDLLIYKLEDNKFLLVVNAANTDKDFQWILEKGKNFNADKTNLSEQYSQIAIQGPEAQEILQKIVDIDLSEIKYYRFKHGKVMNVSAIISRTGYTGEDGFELYFKGGEKEAEEIWFKLLDIGKDKGILPCGLASRDSLRLEAGMPLYGNDIGETTTVLEAKLDWILKFDKGDFIAREALDLQRKRGVDKILVGFEMVEDGIPRPHLDVFKTPEDEEPISFVTSGGYMPYIKKNIGLAYLPPKIDKIDEEIYIGIHGGKKKAKVVPTPFYSRKKK